MINTIKRIFELAGRYKTQMIFGLICNILRSFCTSASFMSIFYIFSKLENLTPQIIQNTFLIVFLSVIGRFFFQWLTDIYLTASGYLVFKDYRILIGKKLKLAPMGYFSEQKLGDIQGTMTTTVSSLENYMAMMLIDLTNGTVAAMFIIAMLAFFNIYIGLLLLTGLICGFIVLHFIMKRAQKNVIVSQMAQENLISKSLEYIRGISVLRSFNQNQKGTHDVKNAFKQKFSADYEQEKNLAWIMAGYSFVYKATSCFSLLLTCILYLNGQISPLYAIAFLISSFFVFEEMQLMSMGVFLCKMINNQLNRLDKVSSIPSIDKSEVQLSPKSFNLQFDGVNFSYSDTQVLQNISVKIPENTRTAIVGPSGSGKTTFCNLIARFWDVNSGKITLDGYDIRNCSYESLIKHISIVFQDVYLFNDTIENNIKFGRPLATDTEIRNAAQKAQAHEFISKLPLGYKTVLSEGGTTLSGGEKQRISIARAILKDAPIIILDEATSSIDPENEVALLKAIEALSKNKTLITIAHKLTTVKNADKIIVIEKGHITQEGTHNELVKQSGCYNNFIKLRTQSIGWKI